MSAQPPKAVIFDFDYTLAAVVVVRSATMLPHVDIVTARLAASAVARAEPRRGLR